VSAPVQVTTAHANGAPEPDPAPAGSVLAHLRSRASQARAERHLDLAVGGAFGDMLVVRYRGLPVGELERYSELQGSVGNLSLAIDMMASCASTVLWSEDGVQTDLACSLGPDLWELLGWDLPKGLELADLSPRMVVDALWHERGMALGSHVSELVAWQTEEQLPEPGESSAPTT
jgi:hypothetical protein